MAGVAGNIAYVASSRQATKGTPPAGDPQYVNSFTGGNLQGEKVIERLQETDSSRDRGTAFTSRFGAAGAPELYVRKSNIGAYLLAAFGGISTAGAGADKTHTITPSNTLPYFTFWRNVGDLLWERCNDCYVNSLTIRGEAGQPLTAVVNFIGRDAVRLAADPIGAAVRETTRVFTFNEAAVTLGGVATSLVRSFEFTIENNVTLQQTDDAIPYDLAAGRREVSLSYDMIFDSIAEYANFQTNSPSGTAQSTTVFTQAVSFGFDFSATESLTVAIPGFAYEEYPVEPDTGGDPIVVSARGGAERQAGGAAIATVTLENQIVSYPAV